MVGTCDAYLVRIDMDADRLPPSRDELQRQARERAHAASPHPDYPNPLHEKSSREIERDALNRRIERERSAVENNAEVAGHDFKREHRERERGGR